MNSHIELSLPRPSAALRPGALALELTRAEKALNLFSAGQVDSVMDEEGFVYLLRGAQQTVLRNEARLEGLLASMPDAITVLDEGGEMLYHSAALTSVLGYAPDAVLGQTFFHLVHADDQVDLLRAVADVIRQRGASTVTTFRCLASDGAWRHLEATASALEPVETGSVVLVMRDASQHRRDRDASTLSIAHAAAEALKTDQFLSMIAHELRTPITPVMMGMHMLREDERFAEAEETLAMMERNLEHQVQLLNELMEFIRIGHQKVQLRLEPIDLHSAVRNVLETCEDNLHKGGLHVLLDLHATEPMVLADPLKLQQIMWNVLNNAIHFSPPGSSITIRTCNPEDGKVCVEFIDQGPGIEPEFLPLVFAPFHQATVSARRRDGLGLGMFIAKGFAEAQNATLAVSSGGRGLGTVFLLTMPN
jgi:two-component system CheB/CheR fusion protein